MGKSPIKQLDLYDQRASVTKGQFSRGDSRNVLRMFDCQDVVFKALKPYVCKMCKSTIFKGQPYIRRSIKFYMESPVRYQSSILCTFCADKI